MSKTASNTASKADKPADKPAVKAPPPLPAAKAAAPAADAPAIGPIGRISPISPISAAPFPSIEEQLNVAISELADADEKLAARDAVIADLRKKLAARDAVIADLRKKLAFAKAAAAPATAAPAGEAPATAPASAPGDAPALPADPKALVSVRVAGSRPIYEGTIRAPGSIFKVTAARFRALGGLVTLAPALALLFALFATPAALAAPAATAPATVAAAPAKAPAAAAKAAPAPKPPSAERKAAGDFWVAAKTAKKTVAQYAALNAANTAAFAAILKSVDTLRTKDGRSGRGTAYTFYREYEAYLAAGHAPFPGVASPDDFFKRTDGERYWKNRAKPAELLANKSLPFGVRYDSAKRFDWPTRASTQTALFKEAIGTGNLDKRYLKWFRAHIATLTDAEAIPLLTKEIATLATAPASRTRDGAVNDYLGIIAIRKELAAVK